MPSRPISNFGRNVAFVAQDVYSPKTEAEVLNILAQCRGRKMRVVGRLHSWSEAAVAEDVLIDLRHLDEVKTQRRGERVWVTVGAGCQIKRLLTELDRHGLTMPALGLIDEQSLAGAMATGTHGSGRNSLSHYADEIRLAAYDPETGQPTIRMVDGGDELRAARCSLGALGIVVSIGFWARPQYRVEEHFARYSHLSDVLAAEEPYPLQQFYLIPWMWSYYAQHRRETPAPRSRLATLYHCYFHLVFDWGLHFCLVALRRGLRSAALVRGFYRHVLAWAAVLHWRVVDRSSEMLVMEHELFRHIEIEMFVPRSRLAEALDFTRSLIEHCAGVGAGFSAEQRDRMRSFDWAAHLDELRGVYVHHYLICVRRVLPDDTLISMTASATEPWYALSFICYDAPSDRAGFFRFADVLYRAMSALFGGRPHWGKYAPLTNADVEALYPAWPRFRQICGAFDRGGVFRNRWMERLWSGGEEG